MTLEEHFFRGTIKDPAGPGQRIVVGKATKALAERMAIKAAEASGWDWLVEHCRVEGEGPAQSIVVIEHWTSGGS